MDSLNTRYMLTKCPLAAAARLMPHAQSKAGNWKDNNIPTQKAQKDRGLLGTHAGQARRKPARRKAFGNSLNQPMQ